MERSPNAPGNTFENMPLEAIAARIGTPFYVYDAAVIRSKIAALRAMTDSPGLQARFAMKACSARRVLEEMRSGGLWIDAVSGNEVLRARAAGFPGGVRPPAILLSADVFRDSTLETVVREEVLVNVGSPRMLDSLAQAGWRGPVGLRLNPGFGHGHVRACDTGGPSSKHGVWPDDEPAFRRHAAELGLRIVLIHDHIGTGAGIAEFDANMEKLIAFYSARVAEYPSLEAVNLGGGIPHPYRPGEPPVDLGPLSALLRRARDELSRRAGRPIRIEIEPGRYLVVDAGTLITRITDLKRTGTNEKGEGQTFVMVDAGFVDLVRPAMYGAYHTIEAVGRPRGRGTLRAVIAGPLCESGDVFTRDAAEFIQPREIPRVEPGDLLAIRDAGAYGASMSSNYNSIGRAPQVWVDGGKVHLISRRESVEDLVRTECWEELG
jgi:diaminopimelate decarboxylase